MHESWDPAAHELPRFAAFVAPLSAHKDLICLLNKKGASYWRPALIQLGLALLASFLFVGFAILLSGLDGFPIRGQGYISKADNPLPFWAMVVFLAYIGLAFFFPVAAFALEYRKFRAGRPSLFKKSCLKPGN